MCNLPCGLLGLHFPILSIGNQIVIQLQHQFHQITATGLRNIIAIGELQLHLLVLFLLRRTYTRAKLSVQKSRDPLWLRRRFSRLPTNIARSLRPQDAQFPSDEKSLANCFSLRSTGKTDPHCGNPCDTRASGQKSLANGCAILVLSGAKPQGMVDGAFNWGWLPDLDLSFLFCPFLSLFRTFTILPGFSPIGPKISSGTSLFSIMCKWMRPFGAGGPWKASPRPRQPLFAVPTLRELESACRVSIL